ncbi:MAG TPA: hypothetical protein DDW52_02395, partial [Planctomycetaceae bacterium]|nr:hypothetical protein [Planctomycetaceae bacterium]
RQIEARLRTAADGTLLAYDGFENLAGKLRRGRSGFGWSGGWEASGRGASGRGASGRDIGKGTTGTDTKRGNRGQLAEIVQAPDDFVFGHSRAGRRTLLLADGTEIRRRLEAQWAPLEMDTLYVSLLVRRASEASEKQASFQLSLEPESNSPRFMRRHSISFGITSNGSVYLNNAGRVAETPGTFPTDTTCLLVFKYRVNNGSSYASLRVFPHQEQAAGKETDLWTLSDVVALPASELSGVRLYCGANATWQIDELKVGTNWDAVIQPGDFDRR